MSFLKEFRKNRKLTQQEVANRLGISRSFYACIESGKRTPTLADAIKIADFYGFSLEQFRKCV